MNTDLVRTLFDYDPQTGNLLYRQTPKGNRNAHKTPGTKAGVVQSSGYLRVTINAKPYQLHRLVWLWHGNDLPESHDMKLMHINQDRTDNRIENLHLVSHSKMLINYNLQREEPDMSEWLS